MLMGVSSPIATPVLGHWDGRKGGRLAVRARRQWCWLRCQWYTAVGIGHTLLTTLRSPRLVRVLRTVHWVMLRRLMWVPLWHLATPLSLLTPSPFPCISWGISFSHHLVASPLAASPLCPLPRLFPLCTIRPGWMLSRLRVGVTTAPILPATVGRLFQLGQVGPWPWCGRLAGWYWNHCRHRHCPTDAAVTTHHTLLHSWRLGTKRAGDRA